jgi:hypothetical protein
MAQALAHSRRSFRHSPARCVAAHFMTLLLSHPPWASELVTGAEHHQSALDAFHKYRQLAQSQFDAQLAIGNPFLTVDMLAVAQREAAYADLRAGKPYIERFSFLEGGQPVNCPGGIIHH